MLAAPLRPPARAAGRLPLLVLLDRADNHCAGVEQGYEPGVNGCLERFDGSQRLPVDRLREGKGEPRRGRIHLKDTGTAGDAGLAAEDEEAVQPGAVVAMVLGCGCRGRRGRAGRTRSGSGRVVLGRDHVEGVEIIGDMALELRAPAGRKHHAMLGAAHPDVLPAA